MHEQLLIDTIILLILFIVFFLILTIKKMRDLLMLDYKLNDTGVPIKVTQMVEAAESYYYSQNKGNQWIVTGMHGKKHSNLVMKQKNVLKGCHTDTMLL